jgi:Zn-dependent protease
MSSPQWLPPVPATAPPAPLPEQSPPPPVAPEPEGFPARRLLGPLLVIGALALKFGKTALLLGSKVKFLSTSASMLVSIAAYSLIWGWRFALGFVLLLFVHEMGHVVQLRREGVPASAPMFIPFLGAVVGMKRMPDDAAAEARVGLAGPVLGTLGTAALACIAVITGSELLQALAFVGFFLNLFNLAPVLPLDGGRAMAAMAPGLWYVGFALIVVGLFVFPNPILILIAIFGGMETWRRIKERRAGEETTRAYYRVTPRTRWLVGAVYLGLIVFCAVGMQLTHLERTLDDV